MSTLSDLTKAPVTIDYKGTKYQLSPLSLKTKGLLDRWLEEYPILRVKRLLEASQGRMPDSVTEKMWDEAYRQTNPMTEEGGQFRKNLLLTAEGLCEILFHSLQPNHPEITRELVSDIIQAGSLEQLQQKVDEVNLISDPQELKNS